MIRFAELLEENANELALLETLDMGKPIRFSKAVDVAVPPVRFAGLAKRLIKFTMNSHQPLTMK